MKNNELSLYRCNRIIIIIIMIILMLMIKHVYEKLLLIVLGEPIAVITVSINFNGLFK